MRTHAILVADDDPEVLNYLETALLCDKYPVLSARDGNEALALLEENKNLVSTVVLDALMLCKGGLETLLEIRRLYPSVPVVIVSGASDPERIVEAMKSGAQEYLTKPVDQEKLLAAVRRSVAARPPGPEPVMQLAARSPIEGPVEGRIEAIQPVPPKAPEPGSPAERYVQVNPRMRAISEALRKTACWNVPVVLRGESGVGKEVLARELHLLSPRASKEFVKINCVALPSELLESELFGYERGAFTGAFRSKPGKFELADGGTILLDEIGDMDLKLQAKLLQVLQDGEIHRLGGKEPVRVDVRVLVATHRDLERSIAEGSFREDLYYRLNVVSIEVPPLRERKDEILPLAEHFLEKHCQGEQAPTLTEGLRAAFLHHDWPGNVRELENVVRRYLVFEDAPGLARQLLAAAAARTGFRSIDDRFPADPANIATAGTQPAPFPAVSGDGRLAAFRQAAGASGGLSSGPGGMAPSHGAPNPAISGSGTAIAGGPPATPGDRHSAGAAHDFSPAPGFWQGPGPSQGSAPAGPSSSSTNGFHAPTGQAGSRIPDRTDFPPHASASVDVTLEAFEANSAPQATPPDGRSLADPDLAAALAGGQPQNSDGWMSRLARLESLLGCLVLGVSEKQQAVPAEPEPPPGENVRQFVTLDELDEERNQAETQAILAALEKTEWNRKKAAKLLKTDYKALLYRMKKLGVGERNDQVG